MHAVAVPPPFAGSHVIHSFREIDRADLRDRFLDFEPVALAAFLRSALP